ncbi:MAG: leucine-rich repeat domain-containing protein [Verrucomicrobiia bacterium]
MRLPQVVGIACLLGAAIMPVAVQAQFTFITNGDNTITITGYTGSGGGVTIPDTINGLWVTTIADGAFDYSVTQTNITIPDTVTNIGIFAFANCVSLTAITVDAGNSFFSSVAGVLFNQTQTLLIQFPKSKTGGYAIPNTVTKIGDYAFYNKYVLNSVTIPNSVTSIGENAFGNSLLTAIVIPDSVTNIGGGAFGECIWLTNVMIGSSVATIGETAFVDCHSLTNIEIPNSVTRIENDAFENCSRLTSIIIPDSVTNIGIAVLWGCASLTSAKLPNSLNNFGNFAFYDCYSLTNIMLPDNATNIGDYAFNDCQSLVNLIIPDSVTSIGYESFYGCSSLTNITIPNSVSSIGDSAFAGCTSLVGIFFRGNAPDSVGSFVFDVGTNLTAYYLPGTTGWDDFTLLTGVPTALWLPAMLTTDGSFGVETNQFGFNISWAGGQTVVVEACTNLANPVWQPVQTNTLTTGSAFFSDPQWTNYPGRFYRLRSP